MDSYKVIECPLFKRDSFDGGNTKDVFIKHEPPKIDDSDVYALACAIIARYAEDWKALEYGKLTEVYMGGAHIYKVHVLKFFASQWFGDLLSIALPNIEPPEVWKALKIEKRMLKGVMNAE